MKSLWLSFSLLSMLGWIYWHGSPSGTWSYADHALASQGTSWGCMFSILFLLLCAIIAMEKDGDLGYFIKSLPSPWSFDWDFTGLMKIVLGNWVMLAVSVQTSLAPGHVLQVAHGIMLLALHFVVLLLVHTLFCSCNFYCILLLKTGTWALWLLSMSFLQTPDNFLQINTKISIRKISSRSLKKPLTV